MGEFFSCLGFCDYSCLSLDNLLHCAPQLQPRMQPLLYVSQNQNKANPCFLPAMFLLLEEVLFQQGLHGAVCFLKENHLCLRLFLKIDRKTI
jgi:hypothetical protein